MYSVRPCQSVRAVDRTYADAITKYSRIDRFPISIETEAPLLWKLQYSGIFILAKA